MLIIVFFVYLNYFPQDAFSLFISFSRFNMANYPFSRCILSCSYFSLVANPPRMCRSCLFFSSTFLTCAYKLGLNCLSRWVTSLWTVLLDMLKLFAACRTVASFSMMYCANRTARSSGKPFTRLPSPVHFDSVVHFMRARSLFILIDRAIRKKIILCSFSLQRCKGIPAKDKKRDAAKSSVPFWGRMFSFFRISTKAIVR